MCSPDRSEKDDEEEEQTVSTDLTSLSVSFLTPAIGAELHSDGISILLARPPENIRPSARLATFFAFVPTAKTLSSPQVLCPGQKAVTCLISNPFHGHLPRQLPSVVQIGFALLPRLPGWQGQTLHPPQHASEQAPREMALRQQ